MLRYFALTSFHKTAFFFTTFLVLNSFFIDAQTNVANYQRLDDNPRTKTAAITELNNRYKLILKKLPSEYKDEYEELYTDMQEEKLKHIENDAYLFNDTLQDYFTAILTEIKRGNPSIPIDNIPFYVARDYSPNAVTSLDGSIAFNLSLLANCKNESQVAFVICHELAHYQLKHPARSVKKMFDVLYSKKGQKDMKEIARSEYNTYQKAEEYLKNAVYDSRRHGREYEEQADSLAVMFMANTRYNAAESASCLLMLDQIDSVLFTPNFDLTKVFTTPQYPFKKSWIEEEETMFGGGKRVFDNELNKDSLKTHPSCQKRAILATNFIKDAAAKSTLNNPQTDALFNSIQQKAEFETLIAAYDFDNVDYALFQTLKSLQNQPNNVFLNAYVGHCLNAVHEGQRAHKLSKIVSIATKNKPKSYQDFLRFLNTMSLPEIASVSYNFLNKQDKSYLKDEFFLYTFLISAQNANKNSDVEKHKELYLTTFPKGSHYEIVSKM